MTILQLDSLQPVWSIGSHLNKLTTLLNAFGIGVLINMKTWKEKIKTPNFGICTVKEATDKESNGKIAPISHGFVNLYHNDVWVGFCGVSYAEKNIIQKSTKPKTMNTKEKKEVCEVVENEGFDYAFQHYSNFSEIKDKKFHELRKAYLTATKELSEYIEMAKYGS